VHVEALGALSIGGEPMRRDALFRIASMTKPVTAAATLADRAYPAHVRGRSAPKVHVDLKDAAYAAIA